MKKVCLLMLACSIAMASRAQNTDADYSTENFSRKFTIKLDGGDQVQLELTHLSGLTYLQSLEAMIRTFLEDLTPFRDSFMNPSFARKVEYRIIDSVYRQIRIRNYLPVDSSFIISGKVISPLKKEQDTIVITGKYVLPPEHEKKRRTLQRYRISFYLNDLADLAIYNDGQLESLLETLKENVTSDWIRYASYSTLKNMPEVTAERPYGKYGKGTTFRFHLSASVQNYLGYVVPSVATGIMITTDQNHHRRRYSLVFENHLIIAKNADKKWHSNDNTFLTARYTHWRLDNNTPTPLFNPSISLGKLVRRHGDLYPKNTYKISAFYISLFKKLFAFEPVMYFNDSFQNISPSARLTLSF